ncbi:MAG: protein kinase [Chloroflexota bacterium]|nr:protein kinase [Chloroflexota bacterium]
MLDRIDRYELKERIGAGGQATVYLAEDTVLERQVAVKVMNQIVSEEEAFADRFMKEARLAASLTHRNIATVYDFKIEKDYACIIMEYLPNSVDKILHRNGPLSPPRASQITIHAAEALQHAHNNGVVHRDIKPHNILLSPEGMAKVTDFGIARASDLISTTDTVGTPVYMSPEQCRRENVSDVRSDIYSLGVSFYEMLSGHPPFQGSYQELTEAHLSQPVPRFDSSLNIPQSLESIVMKCLAKDPDYRFQTSQELATSLRALFGGNTPQETITNQPDGSPSPAQTTQVPNILTTPVEVILKPSRWSRIVAAMSLTAALIFLIINSEKVLNQFRNIDELVPGQGENVEESDEERVLNSREDLPPVIISQQTNKIETPSAPMTRKPDTKPGSSIEDVRPLESYSFEMKEIEDLEYSIEFPWVDEGGLTNVSKLTIYENDLGDSPSITVNELSNESIEDAPSGYLILRSVRFDLDAAIDENLFTTLDFDVNKEWLESESIDMGRIRLLATDGKEWYELETTYIGMSSDPSGQYYERFESETEDLSTYLIAIAD